MKGDKIKYRKGYKYQLAEPYSVYVGIPGHAVTPFLTLEDGWLHIATSYVWDGASGPTFDTKSSMRGSLVHDAGYQLIRLGLIPMETRPQWDDQLHNICVEDGMWHWRAEGWEEAVSHFAEGSAMSGAEPEILEAP